MKAKWLKEIKDSIRQLKRDRDWMKGKVEEIRKDYASRIAEYDSSNHWDRRLIESQEAAMRKAIDRLYEYYDCDTTFHLIYTDGTQCICSGVEILAGDVTPKMIHIAYACYADAYQEYDTESGVLVWPDWETDEELQASEEARERYFGSIEIKFGTDWGKRHAAAQ